MERRRTERANVELAQELRSVEATARVAKASAAVYNPAKPHARLVAATERERTERCAHSVLVSVAQNEVDRRQQEERRRDAAQAAAEGATPAAATPALAERACGGGRGGGGVSFSAVSAPRVEIRERRSAHAEGEAAGEQLEAMAHAMRKSLISSGGAARADEVTVDPPARRRIEPGAGAHIADVSASPPNEPRISHS